MSFTKNFQWNGEIKLQQQQRAKIIIIKLFLRDNLMKLRYETGQLSHACTHEFLSHFHVQNNCFIYFVTFCILLCGMEHI